ncbi:hypothetical protein HJFPF1_05693 [Paramyrothecium foliicola]|nr:hypothetical protein HJFPF1_05693 [Paramyrothecium foliicola]
MDSKEQLANSWPLYSVPTTPQTPISRDGKGSEWAPSHASTLRVPTSIPSNRWQRMVSRSRPISVLIWTFFGFVFFSILHCLFIYFVLIRGEVIIGRATLDASTTNLLVSIFSQASAILADTTLRQLLGALRLFFATRPQGTSAFTWFGIGLSSQWVTTAKFAMASYLLNAWCLLRLALPLLNLGFGSVLKFQADFDYYFVPGQVELPVYAGLIPVDTKLLNMIQTPDLCQYFTTWASSLQGNSRYATETTLDGCGDDCKALLWPGGLETVRQVGPYLNTSIFHDGSFQDVDAIQISHVRGYTTTFRDLDPTFFFNVTEDCIFGGQMNRDGFKICVQQRGDDIAAGWATCPQKVYDKKACDTDEEWKHAPMKTQLLMSAYHQFTTTTYSRQNLSILHTEPEGDPKKVPLIASDYADIFDTLLVPKLVPSLVTTDVAQANRSVSALTYALNWVHRVYGEIFTDEENTLATVLQNFLSIPIQFAVTAHQLANYTIGRDETLRLFLGDFPLPEDMITTATGGVSTQRLVIKDWTGWTFIAVDGAVLMIVFLGIICILQHQIPLPTLTGLTELDILIEADKMMCMEEEGQMPLKKLPIVKGVETSPSYTRSLRPWRMKYIA